MVISILENLPYVEGSEVQAPVQKMMADRS